MQIRNYGRLGFALVALLMLGGLLTLWADDALRETATTDAHDALTVSVDSVSDGVSIDPRSDALVESPIEIIDSAALDDRSDASIGDAPDQRGAAGESPAAEAGAADGRGIEPLLEGLKHPDPLVFAHAVEALSQVDPEQLVSVLEAQLEEGPVDESEDLDESKRRTRAAWGLGIVGSRSGVDPLIRAFGGTDPEVRDAAAGSLAQIGGDQAREFLFEAAEFSDRESGSAAIVALAFDGGEQVRNDLVDAFDQGLIAPDDFPDDALEELSIAPAGPGCLGPNWTFPSCSRAVTALGDEVPDQTRDSLDDGTEAPDGDCLGSGWRLPDCSWLESGTGP